MKPCKACKRTLPLSAFYVHPGMADGHLNKCKECVLAYTRARSESTFERRAAYERERSKRPERREAQRVYRLGYAKANRAKINARQKVKRAVRAGRIQRQPCTVCGSLKSQGHHEDYSKALDVLWLCPRCHHRHHHQRRSF